MQTPTPQILLHRPLSPQSWATALAAALAVALSTSVASLLLDVHEGTAFMRFRLPLASLTILLTLFAADMGHPKERWFTLALAVPPMVLYGICLLLG